MKKTLIIIALTTTIFASCNSKDKAEQEKKDSIAAAATADSLLNATLAADSAKVDSLVSDTAKTK